VDCVSLGKPKKRGSADGKKRDLDEGDEGAQELERNSLKGTDGTVSKI